MNEIQKGRCCPTRDSVLVAFNQNIPTTYTHLIEKKRIFDLTFYTIFLVLLTGGFASIIRLSNNKGMFASDEILSELALVVLLILGVWIIGITLDKLVNYNYHTLINIITNLAPP
jgi:hypothetical protein